VPSREFLIAHAIVHGYAQHGSSPAEYPMMRMVADVADLRRSDSPDHLAEHCHAWVADEMTLEEVRAVCRLAALLQSGAPVEPESPEGCVLRHIVASIQDEDYRRSLKLDRMDALSKAGEWLPTIRRVIAPTRAELEHDRGPIGSRLSYLVQARLHAFRKLGLAASAVIARMRLRLRRAAR
jgi:hypothetical protein